MITNDTPNLNYRSIYYTCYDYIKQLYIEADSTGIYNGWFEKLQVLVDTAQKEKSLHTYPTMRTLLKDLRKNQYQSPKSKEIMEEFFQNEDKLKNDENDFLNGNRYLYQSCFYKDFGEEKVFENYILNQELNIKKQNSTLSKVLTNLQDERVFQELINSDFYVKTFNSSNETELSPIIEKIYNKLTEDQKNTIKKVSNINGDIYIDSAISVYIRRNMLNRENKESIQALTNIGFSLDQYTYPNFEFSDHDIQTILSMPKIAISYLSLMCEISKKSSLQISTKNTQDNKQKIEKRETIAKIESVKSVSPEEKSKIDDKSNNTKQASPVKEIKVKENVKNNNEKTRKERVKNEIKEKPNLDSNYIQELISNIVERYRSDFSPYLFDSVDFYLTQKYPITDIKLYLEGNVKSFHQTAYSKKCTRQEFVKVLNFLDNVKYNGQPSPIKSTYSYYEGEKIKEATEKEVKTAKTYLEKNKIALNDYNLRVVLRRLIRGGDINSKFHSVSKADEDIENE